MPHHSHSDRTIEVHNVEMPSIQPMPHSVEQHAFTIPSAVECSDMETVAKTIDALSGRDRLRVSSVDIRNWLVDNCDDARGPRAENFIQTRIPKAMKIMVEAEMLDLQPSGYLLTTGGRWSLLHQREPESRASSAD
jgi:hypothetical protein